MHGVVFGCMSLMMIANLVSGWARVPVIPLADHIYAAICSSMIRDFLTLKLDIVFVAHHTFCLVAAAYLAVRSTVVVCDSEVAASVMHTTLSAGVAILEWGSAGFDLWVIWRWRITYNIFIGLSHILLILLAVWTLDRWSRDPLGVAIFVSVIPLMIGRQLVAYEALKSKED